jgi:PleD family two-component response regulator
VSIENLQCKFNETTLPKVTASIGVATSPPESRGKDMETLADDRQNRAKKDGKNRVISN